jgi:hypothetical protein
MYSLNENETLLINAMFELHEKGVISVAIDIPEYSKKLFPYGCSIEKYNDLVPSLVIEGFLQSSYDAPRDGPILKLTKKALELFSNG